MDILCTALIFGAVLSVMFQADVAALACVAGLAFSIF
jgi:hypothetical protein